MLSGLDLDIKSTALNYALMLLRLQSEYISDNPALITTSALIEYAKAIENFLKENK